MMIRILPVMVLAVALLSSCSEDRSCEPSPVNHGNHAPVIAQVGDTTAAMWDTLRVGLSASDEDGDSVALRLVSVCNQEVALGRCPRAGLSSAPQEFWFMPRSHDAPWRQFMVIAEDGKGGSDSTEFTVWAEARVDTAAFRAMARGAPCTHIRNRLFLIDSCLVFWEVQGSCYDTRFRNYLFGSTPDDLLCLQRETVFGIMWEYRDSSYRDLFERILYYLPSGTVDPGPGHEVTPIDL